MHAASDADIEKEIVFQPSEFCASKVGSVFTGGHSQVAGRVL